jgi:hypothetical protein
MSGGIDKFQLMQLQEKYDELGKAHIALRESLAERDAEIAELKKYIAQGVAIMFCNAWNDTMEKNKSLKEQLKEAAEYATKFMYNGSFVNELEYRKKAKQFLQKLGENK